MNVCILRMGGVVNEYRYLLVIRIVGGFTVLRRIFSYLTSQSSSNNIKQKVKKENYKYDNALCN